VAVFLAGMLLVVVVFKTLGVTIPKDSEVADIFPVTSPPPGKAAGELEVYTTTGFLLVTMMVVVTRLVEEYG